MSKIPTAKEFLLENADRFQSTTPSAWMIEFAKLHVEAALKVASQKATTWTLPWPGDNIHEVSKDSILKSYPLENIK